MNPWHAGLLTLLLTGTATAEKILDQTTPFSGTRACQQLHCKLFSEARVGPYVLYTYSHGDRSPEASGFFALKKNERNIALGIYMRQDNGVTDIIPLHWVDALLKSLELGRPNELKKYLGRSDNIGISPHKLFSLPLTQKLILSNKSASDGLRLVEDIPIPVIYLTTPRHAREVAAFLNREDRQAKARIIAEIKTLIGVRGECKPVPSPDGTIPSYVDSKGKRVDTDQRIFNRMRTWADSTPKKGMIWTNGMEFGRVNVPGLSRTGIVPMYNFNYPDMQQIYVGVCFD